GHLAGEDRVPAFQELRIRDVDVERLPQAGKERRVVDAADLVILETVVHDKAPGKVGGLATRVPCPARHYLVETDIEHDTAEVEQQDVGGGGRWRQIHGNR